MSSPTNNIHLKFSYTQPAIIKLEIKKSPGTELGFLPFGKENPRNPFVWNILDVTLLVGIFYRYTHPVNT
jgi:hypothetical protein